MAELRSFKLVLEYKNALAQKVGVAHALQVCINVNFQVSLQINEFL